MASRISTPGSVLFTLLASKLDCPQSLEPSSLLRAQGQPTLGLKQEKKRSEIACRLKSPLFGKNESPRTDAFDSCPQPLNNRDLSFGVPGCSGAELPASPPPPEDAPPASPYHRPVISCERKRLERHACAAKRPSNSKAHELPSLGSSNALFLC